MNRIKRLRRPSPALIVGCLALFLAAGGPAAALDVSQAAAKLITGKQIKNKSITGKDIHSFPTRRSSDDRKSVV